MDSKQLYQEVILDHNKKAPELGQARRCEPSRGGRESVVRAITIWISLRIDEGNIAAVAFEGESCAICKASASMMTANVKGKSVEAR
jgi:nitrogen fixation NifU-like protein